MKGDVFLSAQEILKQALIKKQSHIKIEKCTSKLEVIFRTVLSDEPRLLICLESYKYTMLYGITKIIKDYEIDITYRENVPDDMKDIILDRGEFDVRNLLKGNYPATVFVVTDDVDRFQKHLNQKMSYIISSFEGLVGWEIKYWQLDSLSSDYAVRLIFQYMMPENELKIMKNKTNFEVKRIWRKILGNANVPIFVKPFLAFSYLTQEVKYDEKAAKELALDDKHVPSDPIPHLSYGPLVENRGICSGLAWAFKKMMDDVGIECITVGGYLREDQSIGHAWNIVKLGGQYYHIDPTSGIKNVGVYVDKLLKDDDDYFLTHIWNIRDYPSAKGSKLDYDVIEDFLAEKGNEFLDAGADEKYMFPNNIIE